MKLLTVLPIVWQLSLVASLLEIQSVDRDSDAISNIRLLVRLAVTKTPFPRTSTTENTLVLDLLPLRRDLMPMGDNAYMVERLKNSVRKKSRPPWFDIPE